LALERKISEERIAKFIIFVDRIMLLPKGLDEEFSEFLKLKLKKFMGRPKTFDARGTSSDFLMRLMYKSIHGVELSDVEQDLAQEKALRLEQEKELEKERFKVVQTLQAQDWTASKIADVLGYDLTWVETVLKKNKKKQLK
jgi:hypothetical protein